MSISGQAANEEEVTDEQQFPLALCDRIGYRSDKKYKSSSEMHLFRNTFYDLQEEQ